MTPTERAFADTIRAAIRDAVQAGDANSLVLASICAATAGGLVGGCDLPENERLIWTGVMQEQVAVSCRGARATIATLECVGTA